MTDLKTQIKLSLETYADNCMAAADGVDTVIGANMKEAMRITIKQAMLSGMSLTSHFFAANDGHKDITPQAFEKAALEVGMEMSLVVEQLSANMEERFKQDREERERREKGEDQK